MENSSNLFSLCSGKEEKEDMQQRERRRVRKVLVECFVWQTILFSQNTHRHTQFPPKTKDSERIMSHGQGMVGVGDGSCTGWKDTKTDVLLLHNSLIVKYFGREVYRDFRLSILLLSVGIELSLVYLPPPKTNPNPSSISFTLWYIYNFCGLLYPEIELYAVCLLYILRFEHKAIDLFRITFLLENFTERKDNK